MYKYKWIPILAVLGLAVSGGYYWFATEDQTQIPISLKYHDKAVQTQLISDTRSFLAAVDGGRYADTWETLLPALRKHEDVKLWVFTLSSQRQQLDSPKERQFIADRHLVDHRSLGRGFFYELEFETDFGGQILPERIVFGRHGDNQWSIADYRLGKKDVNAPTFSGLFGSSRATSHQSHSHEEPVVTQPAQ